MADNKLIQLDSHDDDSKFTTGEVAEFLDKSPQTIRNWSADVYELLSLYAAPQSGRSRTYTITDVRVLQYVKEQRDLDMPMESIIISLRNMKQDSGAIIGLPEIQKDEIKNRLALSEDTMQRITISMLRDQLDTSMFEVERLRKVEIEKAKLEGRIEEKEGRIEKLENDIEELKAEIKRQKDDLSESYREAGYYKGRLHEATNVEEEDTK